MLLGIIFSMKVEATCGLDNRNILINLIKCEDIPLKDRKIVLSILLNNDIQDNLKDIAKEYERLLQIEDPWGLDEQLNWKK